MFKPYLWLIAGIVALGLIATSIGGVTYLHNRWYTDGYNQAIQETKTKLVEEKLRQTEIIKRIEQAHENDIDIWREQNVLLRGRLEEAEAEAAKEPTRNDIGLSASGVSRLNRIR